MTPTPPAILQSIAELEERARFHETTAGIYRDAAAAVRKEHGVSPMVAAPVQEKPKQS